MSPQKHSDIKREYYAHSVDGRPTDEWQPLDEHLLNVAELAGKFADEFSAGEWAYLGVCGKVFIFYSYKRKPDTIDYDFQRGTWMREQVKRNRKQFPVDFMFQLSEKEIDSKVSQNAIPSRKYLGGHKPYVFTEQGIHTQPT